MIITELSILRWLHIIAMVYWLGGEWGVFQTSRYVINQNLPMDERHRHMETAYRIDILARTGILLLFPLGFHMGFLWGIHAFGGYFLTLNWFIFISWLILCWSAFYFRNSDRGIRLTKIDEAMRFIFIPLILTTAVSSLLGYGPYNAEPGQHWFSIKILIFSLLLVMGLKLRFIMREWTELFRLLAQKPHDSVIEKTLERSLSTGRKIAYFYWIGIASAAFLGTTKAL